jgi:hypothetical protein
MTAVPQCQPRPPELRRPAPWDTATILIGGISVIGFGAFAITLILAILYVVGETVEHFTP